MFVVVTMDHRILSVLKHPSVGETTEVTGKYVWPVPEGVRIRVTESSVILPVADPNSIVQQSFLGLLNNHPQYTKIVWNSLLTPTDMNGLDLSASLNEGGNTWSTRAQIGRETGGPLPPGISPGSVAILPENPGTVPPKPGVLVSNTIDIGPLTGGEGASQFSLYWYIATYQLTEDVSSSYGLFAGQNSASIKTLNSVRQTLSGFTGFLSVDDGGNFLPAGRLEPVSFCDPGTLIRVGFKNQTAQKIYILGFAILF